MSEAVARFVDLVRGPEPPLDEAALALAAGADPDLEAERWLGELDRLAAGVDSLPALVRRLFVEEGFAGDTGDYGDPRNSLLPEVLTRKLGIPITLAVVCIEVGRRAGIALEGVGMPGHFLVRVPHSGHLLDVFDGGRRLDRADCAELYRRATGSTAPFGPHLLPRVSTREILLRMLENLRAAQRRRGGPADREWVLRMRLALRSDADALVELGEVLAAQARWDEGARLIAAYLSSGDQPPEVAERLRRTAAGLLAHLN
ncbi:transglutaminase-like domain-containing protein [Pseudonocardia oroxyli]|uniref:Regulator of sirC expression, contains transglutaminase-like and TPR domains n=1 Tax=Pseudonocardia oroxyli TaxID=366584 RepID=A0A1G7PH94_PSEOR|nr:transglutaminase-like domain-containing protein [Pseudonocardia oroxyli]SDF85623.1 Regulator of sirC expression, contains transglutaminase-like and TPR domains [Pseudonocardia oroxyli]